MKQGKLIIFLLLLFVADIAYAAATMKRIDVGKLQTKVFDDGIQSATNLPMTHCKYKRGYFNVAWDDEETNTYYPGGFLRRAGLLVGNRNWTDPDGVFWPYHVTGHCPGSSTVNDNPYQFNVPDELGIPIKRFFAYPPPQIIVNGMHAELPFGSGDYVDPDAIWGTADVMIECHWRLSNGMDVYQRNLAWSQRDLDDVVFWDLTFVNTGNTDRDEDIELPGQTLDSVVILRHYDAMPNGGNYPFGTWAGVTERHTDRTLEYPLPRDSLRINYVALARKTEHTHDSYGDKCEKDWGGDVNLEDGCGWTGHVILFAPCSTSVQQTHPLLDFFASDDPAQPSMHSTIEGGYACSDVEDLLDTADHSETYKIMRMGIRGYEDQMVSECQNVYPMSRAYNVYDVTATGAPTYYDQPQDRMGEWQLSRGEILPRDWDYYEFSTTPKFSIGPYNMEYLDTLRFVFAIVAGAVDRKTTYLLSEARADGEARNYEWLAGMDSASIRREYERRDPVAELFGDEVYMGGGLNEIATDYVISTGKDSLLYNGMAARQAFNLNYDIPTSPAPPSIFRVNSRDDVIALSWSYEPGYEPTDLAGFKIYRAAGGTLYEKAGEIVTGDWKLVDSVGPTDTLYGDTLGILRGLDYYYCITAVSTAGIESGMWLTMTDEAFPANLLDPVQLGADSLPTLAYCRIVPNPLNIRDPKQRFPGNANEMNKVSFRRLTERCTIRIFTESGELIKTLNHDGGGTEFWKIVEEGTYYTTTVNNQRPASGLYIAHIQDNDTGESVFRKFVIIR
jgi:hypothetical protein